MKRLLLFAPLFLPVFAQAQLQLNVIDSNGAEQPAPAVLDLGSVSAGDSVEAKFRVRNPGQAKASLDKLYIAGAGFALAHDPTIPLILAAGAWVDFGVRFAPRQFGSYSASLTVNTASMLVVGRTPSVLTLLDGNSVLGAAAPLDFGTVEVGKSATRRLTLRNDTGSALPLPAITVQGDAFHGPDGLGALGEVGAGASAVFTVTFTPAAANAVDGWLLVGQRPYHLLGAGTNPPFPHPTLVLDNPAVGSGGRAGILVRLGVAAPFDASGTLTLQLNPSSPGAQDDAVQFLAGGRSLPVTVKKGDVNAAVDAAFQAGTTAGEILFTVTLAGWTDTLHVPITPQVVSMDSAKAVRTGAGVEVDVTGFDNTRNLSQLKFTFFLADGTPLATGPVSVAVGQSFTDYFATSTLGGSFALKVQFPVTGDARALGGVEMEAVNSAGSAKTRRLSF